jgi:hypothetical protein
VARTERARVQSTKFDRDRRFLGALRIKVLLPVYSWEGMVDLSRRSRSKPLNMVIAPHIYSNMGGRALPEREQVYRLVLGALRASETSTQWARIAIVMQQVEARTTRLLYRRDVAKAEDTMLLFKRCWTVPSFSCTTIILTAMVHVFSLRYYLARD